MARRKKPEGLTPEEQIIHSVKEAIANNANRSEKTSWNRKMDNMVALLAKLRPIEAKIIKLQNQKIPIYDEVQALRSTMVKECVHPYDYVAVLEDCVECKFCGKKMNKPNVDDA